MNVFVAAPLGQEADNDDFSWTVAGELVTLAVRPCSDVECGCQRSMAGISSARATSVFVVADLPITRADYEVALRDGLTRQGWIEPDSNPPWFREFVAFHVEDAAMLPVGAPLRLEDGEFIVRRWSDAA